MRAWRWQDRESGAQFFSEEADGNYAIQGRDLMAVTIEVQNPYVIDAFVPQIDMLEMMAADGVEGAAELLEAQQTAEFIPQADQFIQEKLEAMGHDALVSRGDPMQGGNEIHVFDPPSAVTEGQLATIQEGGSAKTVEDEAQAAPEETIPPAQEVEVETAERDGGDEITEETFVQYRPSRVKIPGARPHPTPVAESSAMAAVDAPKPTYRPRLPKDLIETGGLSEVQLEQVVYAGQAHEKFLPAAEGETAFRRGYLVGDGTGVGKGRINAGIILDNWQQGRKKAVWLSENQKLFQDAQRDTEALGLPEKSVFNLQGGYEPLRAKQGILYTTYATLKSQSKDQVPKRRIDQIINWLGEDFDGVIVFDEAHNMANSTETKGARGTRKASARALAGIELQRRLPNARIVYVSATAATEVENLAYAERLGLWGRGTPFNRSDDFINKIKSGGVAAMELVARDMKAMGRFLARNLSFNDGTEKGTVRYERLEHKLTANQRAMYDRMAESWQVVLGNIDAALGLTNADGKAKSNAMSRFWGAHQRFFNQILTSMQTPAVIEQMRKDLEAGNSIVIQLTNTNEAQQERALSSRSKDDDLEDFDASPMDMLMQLVENGFPTQQYEQYRDEDGKIRTRPVLDSQGRPVQNQEAVRMRDQLLDELGSMRGEVPDNPIDFIIAQFGSDMVAEVTGRKRRVERDPETGLNKIVKRGGATNKAEIAAFMDLKKRILIFSEAGGTGASYHASLDHANQQPRRHYLLQAGWRADKAVQGLGRDHRTNQAQAPTYILVHTDLNGQKRFISTIARRLEQLGALSKGHRKGASTGVFSSTDNLESQEAHDALQVFYKDLHAQQIPGLSLESFEQQTGLKLRDEETGGLRSDLPPMGQFLNRLLSMKVDAQNATFDEFALRLQDKVEQAVADGTIDQGVETYKAKRITKDHEEVVYTEPESGAETKYVRLTAIQAIKPITWAQLKSRLLQTAGLVGYYRSPKGKLYAVLQSRNRQAANGDLVPQYQLIDQRGIRYMDRDDFDPKKYKRVADKAVEAEWQAAIDQQPKEREETVHLVTGVILPIWDRIRGDKPRIYRLQTTEGEQLLGRVIEPHHLPDTLKALGAEGAKPNLTPSQALDRARSGSAELELSNGWRITRALVQGEWRLEVKGPVFSDKQRVEADGLFSERVGYQTRWFLPTGPEGVRAYENLTSDKPLVDLIERAKGPGRQPNFDNPEAGAVINPVDAATELGRKVARALHGRKATTASRILTEVEGRPLIDEAPVRDISMAALQLSPEFALEGFPQWQAHSSRLIEAEMYYSHKFNKEFQIFFDDAKHKLSKSDQKLVRRAVEVLLKGDPAEVAALAEAKPHVLQSAQKVREYFEVMRERIKEHKRAMFRLHLTNKKLAQAFERVLAGEPVADVLADVNERVERTGRGQRVERADLADLIREYVAIDQWGLDDYITNIERGTIRLVQTVTDPETGKKVEVTRAIAVTKRDAIQKASHLLETDPEIESLEIDRTYASSDGLSLLVSEGQAHAIRRRIAQALETEGQEIEQAVRFQIANRAVRGTLRSRPANFTAGALKRRKNVLEGEANIFDILPAYAYSVEKKMALDPALTLLRREIHRAPPNIRALLEKQAEDAKGPHSIGNKILDWMIGATAEKLDKKLGTELRLLTQPRSFSRASSKITGMESILKLGWRPAAVLVNKVGGEAHTFTKNGFKYMRRANLFLRTPEGQRFIRREHDLGSLGVNYAVDVSGARHTAVEGFVNPFKDPKGAAKQAIQPLGWFSAVEFGMRERNLAANYLRFLDQGMSEAAAKTSARRAMRFQLFTYNTTALPSYLRSPEARVLFQFKTYIHKELEFISTLSKTEFLRYTASLFMMSGVRGMIYFVRALPLFSSLPFVGAMLDEIEQDALSLPSFLSTGIPGLLGMDIVAASIPQLPNRMEDFVGPFLSDIMTAWKGLTEGLFDLSDPMAVAANFSPLAYYWDQLLDQVLTGDGWIRDRNGNKVYELAGWWDRALLTGGIAPLELRAKKQRLAILDRQEADRREKLSKSVKRAAEFVRRGNPVPENLLLDLELLSGGRAGELIVNQLERGELPPEYRQFQETPEFRRDEVAAELF